MAKDKKVVFIRAIAILIVAFGHSIILYDPSWGIYHSVFDVPFLIAVKSVINMIQMPLFFSISGYCFYFLFKSKSEFLRKDLFKDVCGFLRKKAKRLLIPAAVVAFAWMLPIRILAQYPNWQRLSIDEICVQILSGRDMGHLWYLLVLFEIFIVAYIVIRIFPACVDKFRVVVVILTILLALSVASVKIPWILQMKNFAANLVWFYLGFVINKFGYEFRFVKLRCLFPVLLVAFIVLSFYIRGGIVSLLVQKVCSFLAVASAYSFSCNKENKIINVISKDSFGIYLFHSPMLYMLFRYGGDMNPATVILIGFAVIMPVTIAMTELIRKTRFLKFIIGE